MLPVRIRAAAEAWISSRKTGPEVDQTRDFSDSIGNRELAHCKPVMAWRRSKIVGSSVSSPRSRSAACRSIAICNSRPDSVLTFAAGRPDPAMAEMPSAIRSSNILEVADVSVPDAVPPPICHLV